MKKSVARIFFSFSLCLSVATLPACIKKDPAADLKTLPGELNSAAEKTACLSVFGNGYLFSSHLGAMTALLENNIRPIVAAGNSVATITASLLRGLLQNQSLAQPSVSNLSQSQRAARVLSAGMPVYKTILFPTESNGSELGLSAFKSAVGLAVLKQLVGDMERALFGTNVPLAYGMMAVDFFSSADFSQVVAETNFKKRQSLIREMWIAHTGSLAIDSTTYINDLLRPLAESTHTERAFKVKKRYYEIITGSIFNGQEVTQQNLPEFEKKYKILLPLIKPIKPENLGKIFNEGIEQSISIPVIGTNSNFFGRDILLPDPLRLVASVKGLARDGRVLAIPSGTILHASARALDENNQEKTGWENLFHLYFPASDTYDDLQAKRNALDALDSFLAFAPNNGVIIPKERLVVLKNMRAVDGIRVSISEPNVFAREVLNFVSPQDWANNVGSIRRPLSGFGGWFDAVSLSTLSRLNECAFADVFVYISTPEVNDIVKQIVRGVVQGGRVNPLQGVLGRDKEANTTIERFTQYYNFSKARPSRLGTIGLDFDWGKPSQFSGNYTYIGNKRSAMYLASYFDATKKLKASAMAREFLQNNQTMPFDASVKDPGIPSMKTKEQIGAFADSVFE